MFVKIVERKYGGKKRQYASIVQSYRSGKKVKHQTILNLGHVKTKEDLKRFDNILRSMQSGDEFVNLKNISIKSAKEFGVTYVANELMKRYGIDETLKKHLSVNKAKFDIYEIIKALITNRLIRPSSELSAYDWINKHYDKELNIQEHHLYRALDYLEKGKEDIEVDIFKMLKERLGLDDSLTFYDLTSSYFEGNCCSLAMFGYSRDHRKDRKQIVIGLAICDGMPIVHDVHKGNTADKTTLESMHEKLIQLGIKKTVTVSDSGIMTEDNMEFLEEKNLEYIFGFDRRKSDIAEKLLVKKFVSDENQSAKEVHKEEIESNGKKIIRRYVVCLDKNTRKERLESLKEIRKKSEERLKELKRRYEQNPRNGKKLTRDSLMQQAYKILGKNKRLFNIGFEDKFEFSLNKENWEYEQKIAGKFLLVTNTDMEAETVMKTYRQLKAVENGFDEIKNFLDARPIYHRKDIRVKAHVFVCVLSFMIECIMERFSSVTARKTINEMETVKTVNLDIKGSKKKMITEISKKAEDILKELNIPLPIMHS